MEELLAMLAETVGAVLPKKWRKVFLYSELSANGYDIFFYCFIDGVKEPVQCYNLERFGVSEKSIDEAFVQVYETLRPFWNESAKAETGGWTNCTFSMEKGGACDLDLDYTDLTECAYEHRENWKDKYLSKKI